MSATDASLGGGAAGDPLCRWGWGGFLGLGGGYFLYLFIYVHYCHYSFSYLIPGDWVGLGWQADR